MIDINEIKQILPHRYPFLLVDRILEITEDQKVIALKNVTANEAFFNGHFPSKPVMPGVLIIESMAQGTGVLLLAKEEHRGKTPYFTGIDNARFRRVVEPGDQLLIEGEILKVKGNIARIRAVAKVEGQVAAEAELMFIIKE